MHATGSSFSTFRSSVPDVIETLVAKVFGWRVCGGNSAAAGGLPRRHAEPALLPSAAREHFYADKRSARPIIAGTVARGHLDADTYFYTGKIGSNDGDYLPFPVTAEVMARGQQRFNIYCSPCHSELGDGNGMIVQRGYKHPPSYHIDRLRRAPIGYFFDVMTNGFGAMPDYAEQVPRGRPLGDCSLYSRAAIEPARDRG